MCAGTFEVRENKGCGGAYYGNGVHEQEQLGYGEHGGEQEQYHDQYQGGEHQYQGGGFSDYCSSAAGSPARMLLTIVVSAMSMLLAAI